MNENTVEICARLDAIAGLIDAGQRRVQPDIQPESFSVAASGLNILIPGTQGQRIFVCTIMLVAAGAVNVTPGTADGDTGGAFKAFSGPAGASGTPGLMAFSANAGFAQGVNFPQFIWRTEEGRAFALNLSGAVQVGGCYTYWKA